MNEYHIRLAIGRLDGTWFESEAVVVNDDEGDNRAVEMAIAFVTLLSIEVIEDEDDEDDESPHRGYKLDEEED